MVLLALFTTTMTNYHLKRYITVAALYGQETNCIYSQWHTIAYTSCEHITYTFTIASFLELPTIQYLITYSGNLRATKAKIVVMTTTYPEHYNAAQELAWSKFTKVDNFSTTTHITAIIMILWFFFYLYSTANILKSGPVLISVICTKTKQLATH